MVDPSNLPPLTILAKTADIVVADAAPIMRMKFSNDLKIPRD